MISKSSLTSLRPQPRNINLLNCSWSLSKTRGSIMLYMFSFRLSFTYRGKGHSFANLTEYESQLLQLGLISTSTSVIPHCQSPRLEDKNCPETAPLSPLWQNTRSSSKQNSRPPWWDLLGLPFCYVFYWFEGPPPIFTFWLYFYQELILSPVDCWPTTFCSLFCLIVSGLNELGRTNVLLSFSCLFLFSTGLLPEHRTPLWLHLCLLTPISRYLLVAGEIGSNRLFFLLFMRPTNAPPHLFSRCCLCIFWVPWSCGGLKYSFGLGLR